jgi:hypothetical protein
MSTGSLPAGRRAMAPMAELSWGGGRPHPVLVLAEYSNAIGAGSLRATTPEGEAHHFDLGHWQAWVNPWKAPATGGPDGNTRIPPFYALIEWNGWPWFYGGPDAKVWGDHPDTDGANVEHLYRDCVAALAALGATP